MAGKKQNMAFHVEEIDETSSDLDEPTSFLDHVFLGCTQRDCKPNEIISLKNTEKCSNHEVLLEQLENYQGGKNLTQRWLRGPTAWKDMLQNAR